ncbi:MAG: hypothetical protein Unbinned5406contig1000_44 [Prokaryotic dsDNA virus sp.]|jgi:hypothetical protein|nr:MAG: hypothetical protein Unbinned5406contig1000_44 [Prokaryotic dsDNA virus sp.]|tara:strand:+ start:4177 stop:4617 length:441 start_codon:yes stop_codon:yes gene_type:complete
MLQDEITVKGRLSIVLIDQLGLVKEEHDFDNLVVTTGKGYIASRMKDATATAMSHMAVGTGTTAADVAQTALVTEANRQALTSTAVSGGDVTYSATFGNGQGTGALTEAAILNASSGGTMLCRTVFSVINKGANDTLAITWTVTVS